MTYQGRRLGTEELTYTVLFDDGDRKRYSLSDRTPHVELCHVDERGSDDDVSPRRLRGRGARGGDSGGEGVELPAAGAASSWRADLKRKRS